MILRYITQNFENLINGGQFPGRSNRVVPQQIADCLRQFGEVSGGRMLVHSGIVASARSNILNGAESIVAQVQFGKAFSELVGHSSVIAVRVDLIS
ncbi:hypothetical protein BpHYR1_040638 [Brachionus plicatilis]|uniref:Uncharacterized protein n=1 Tax=Brachionus plicatilis TaxID=10195 RepID=A0A3M7RZ26_BRAPC|nr:hypothetical protein BpHYR1_040638 [Brachionus plicatilis]